MLRATFDVCDQLIGIHVGRSGPLQEGGNDITTGEDAEHAVRIGTGSGRSPGTGPVRCGLCGACRSDAILARIRDATPGRATAVIRTGAAELLLIADRPYLAWLSLSLLDRLRGRLSLA